MDKSLMTATVKYFFININANYIYTFYTVSWVSLFYMFSLNFRPGAALCVKFPYHTCDLTSVKVPCPSSL